MRELWSKGPHADGVHRFFIPRGLGQKEWEEIEKAINEEVWLIARVIQCFGYNEILDMPESDRKFFVEKVTEELKEKEKEANTAKSAARSRRR